MIIQKRGILPVSAFVAGIGLAFSAYAQTAVNLFTNPQLPAFGLDAWPLRGDGRVDTPERRCDR